MRYITFSFGILFILLTLFARRIGIDHDAKWGTNRFLMLATGLALSATSLLVHLAKTGHIPQSARRRFSIVTQAASRMLDRVRRNILISILIVIALLLGFSVYIAWYTSSGLFPTFRRVVNPYVDLGDAFLHGQVALLSKPDPQLIALADPYDYEKRENVPYLWDLSYYKGKYYAYWGPVPALLYAAIEAVTHALPPDQTGVLVFMTGLGLMLALLFFRVRQWYFPRAPGLSVPLFLLATLLNLPNVIMLARPQVYETSVIAGQFFLLLGLLAWLHALRTKKPGWLFLAGLSWGLAVATRYNLLISVAVFLAIALFLLWRDATWNRQIWKWTAALLAPLVLCGLLLALYNYSRFENPFETGLVYQLTLPVYHNRHFSTSYFLSNLYVYLLYPPSARPSFPFLPSIPVQYNRLPAWALLPPGKLFDEVFFGVLPGLPVLWLLAVLVPYALFRDWKIHHKDAKARGLSPSAFRRLLAGTFALAGLLQFLFLLFYYYGANRFIADFLPLFLLVIIFLAWELDERLARRPILRAGFWVVSALLVLATAGMAMLAGFDIPPQLFRQNNPALYGVIARWSNQAYAALLALPGQPGLLGTAIRLLLRVLP